VAQHVGDLKREHGIDVAGRKSLGFQKAALSEEAIS
jgi:hypothetical protein